MLISPDPAPRGFLSNAISVVSNAVSIVSTAASNALSVANAASQAASVVSQVVSVLSQANSAAHASINNAVSVVSQQVSVLSQAASVLSQAVSVVSQSNSVVSQAVSVLSQAVSVLSQNVSVLSNLVCGPVTRVLSGVQTISATVLTNISGFSVSVVALGVYRIDAILYANHGAAAQPYGYGLTFPAMKHIRGKIYASNSAVQGDIGAVSTLGQAVPFNGDSASGSIIVSTVSVTNVSTLVAYVALMVVSTTGTLQLQAKASTTTAALQILDGSYMQVFRIA